MKLFNYFLICCFGVISIQSLNAQHCATPSIINSSGSYQWDVYCKGLWNEARSVVILHVPGNGPCTGTLLVTKGVNPNELRAFVLTARHCIFENGPLDVTNTEFIFNYQRSDCGALVPG